MKKLIPNAVPEKPWTHIMANFIIKLLLVREFNSILVVYNQLTKMVYFIPIIEKTSVEGLVVLFRNNV